MKAGNPKKGQKTKKSRKAHDKHMRTLNSSEFSLLDSHHNLSMLDLSIFKNENIAGINPAANVYSTEPQEPRPIHLDPNGLRGRKMHSALSQYAIQQSYKQAHPKILSSRKRKKKNKSQSHLLEKPKNKSKSKGKSKIRNGTRVITQFFQQQPLEPYEHAQYKESNTNSEIVFSADETKRESNSFLRRDAHKRKILTNMPERQVNSNLVLRVNIKREYTRKVDAATKIQKVYRGYMTRKILMKYIDEEEQRLHCSSQPKQSAHHHMDLSLPVNVHGRLFRRNQCADQLMQAEYGDYKPSVIQLDENELQLAKNSHRRDMEELFNRQMHPFNDREPVGEDIGPDTTDHPKLKSLQPIEQYVHASPRSQHSQSNHQVSSQQQGDVDSDAGGEGEYVYRHQQPIYSHQEIKNYLDSSQSGNDEDEETDVYVPDVIYETNSQYLQSRKSSMQNKYEFENKLSRGHVEIGGDLARGHLELPTHLLQGSSQGAEKSSHGPSCKPLQGAEEQSQRIEGQSQGQSHGQSHRFEQLDVSRPVDAIRNIDKHQVMPTHETQNSETIIQKEIDQTYTKHKSANNVCFFGQPSHSQSPECANQEDQLQRSQHSDPDSEVQVNGPSASMSSESSHRSRSARREQQLMRLREQECQKWDEVIKMVNSQIYKQEQSNGEMVNFMKVIMDFSQRNKDMLGSTKSVNLETEVFTTPTNTNTAELAENDPRNEQQMRESKDFKRYDNFLKKKPLKIQIADSSFTMQEKQQLFEELGGASAKVEELESAAKYKKKQKASLCKARFYVNGQESKSKDFKGFSQLGGSCPIFSEEGVPNRPKTKDECQSRLSSDTFKMKSFLNSNLQDETLEEILQLREEILQKRESQELLKLNQQLSNQQLTQSQFLSELNRLSTKFSTQKTTIDKAKKDIMKGYQAANDLIKNYFHDVKRMGVKLAVSRSQDNLKYKVSNLPLHSDLLVDEIGLTPKSTVKPARTYNTDLFFEDEIIDYEKESVTLNPNRLKKHSPRTLFDEDACETQPIIPHPTTANKSAEKEHGKLKDVCSNAESKSFSLPSRQVSSESEMEFTEEELRRFRKAVSYDFNLNEINGNMTISDDFIRQQKSGEAGEPTQNIFQSVKLSANQSDVEGVENSPACTPKNQPPTREFYLLEQVSHNNSENNSLYRDYLNREADRNTEAVINSQLEALIWEFASEIMVRPLLSEKFIDRSYLSRPAPISIQDRLQFLEIVEQNLPEDSVLCRRLNQKITPVPSEILKCMRLDFQEGEQEDNDDMKLEEDASDVIRYEFVISQEVCAHSVLLFRNRIEASIAQEEGGEDSDVQVLPTIDDIIKFCNFPTKLQRFVEQRQKFLANRKKHTKDLRWEVLNIEIHCLYDSWNEEIIQLCTERPGFSGIGLNEITLSLIDHNNRVPVDKSRQLMSQAKDKVIATLTDETEINAKILKHNFHEMAENDSAWIFYADEALSYALELVYLVEEELYTEVAKEVMAID